MAEAVAVLSERKPVLSTPGLILVMPDSNQVSCNSEALRILSYLSPRVDSKGTGIPTKEKLEALFRQRYATENEFAVIELTSGRRRYRCTHYVLNMQGLQAPKTIVILFERIGSPEVTVQELCNGLHLTEREREAVGLLVRGLTSKEIAQHMGISPNTVKSFLRLVMTKAGVSTRTGLIGRVAGIVPRQITFSTAPKQPTNGANGNAAGRQDSHFKPIPLAHSGAGIPGLTSNKPSNAITGICASQRSYPAISKRQSG
jgi:DNA-binding CsgD family transcriptional regulator